MQDIINDTDAWVVSCELWDWLYAINEGNLSLRKRNSFQNQVVAKTKSDYDRLLKQLNWSQIKDLVKGGSYE